MKHSKEVGSGRVLSTNVKGTVIGVTVYKTHLQSVPPRLCLEKS